MTVRRLVARLLRGKRQEPRAKGHDHDPDHVSEFSRTRPDETPDQAERRREHIRRDDEARRRGERP